MSPSLPQRGLERAAPGSGAGWLRLFFLPFFLLGAGGFGVLTLKPVLQILDARRWTETPCVVESSQLIYEQGEDSTSYAVEVVYHYTGAGQPLVSRRYSFAGAFPSGYHSKQAIVASYPAGRETTCFVNPKAPAEAVLNRGWRAEMGIGFLGLLFALAGGLGLVFAGHIARPWSSAGVWSEAADRAGGPVVLVAKNDPLRKFLAVLIGSLALTGFIGFIAYFLFFVEDREDVALGPRIITGCFLLACLLFLGDAFSKFLALFHPRVRITLQNSAIRPGAEMSFSYTVTGRATRLRNLRMILQGHAQSGGCGNLRAKIPVFETTKPELLLQGVGRVLIPAAEEHPHGVFWSLRVHGKITDCPDLDDEFPLPVLPPQLAS